MKRYLIASIALAGILASSPLAACTIYFTNDTQNAVLITMGDSRAESIANTMADSSQAIPIGANKTKMFGDGTKHAVFTVWQKSKGADRYHKIAFLKQHGCNKGKKIDLKMSDVQRGIVKKELFNATVYGNKTK